MKKVSKMKRMWLVMAALVCVSATWAGTTPLTTDMFKAWDGTGADAKVTGTAAGEIHIGEDLGAGAMVYGVPTVYYLNYADLSAYGKIVFEGTPGVQLRVMLNRLVDEGTVADGNLTEVNVTIGEDGKAEVSFAGMAFVHLNAIKTSWGSPAGTITKIYLEEAELKLNLTAYNEAIAAAEAFKTTLAADTYFEKEMIDELIVAVDEAIAYTQECADMATSQEDVDMAVEMLNETVGMYKGNYDAQVIGFKIEEVRIAGQEVLAKYPEETRVDNAGLVEALMNLPMRTMGYTAEQLQAAVDAVEAAIPAFEKENNQVILNAAKKKAADYAATLDASEETGTMAQIEAYNGLTYYTSAAFFAESGITADSYDMVMAYSQQIDMLIAQYDPMIQKEKDTMAAKVTVAEAQELLASYSNPTDKAGFAAAIAKVNEILGELNMWDTMYTIEDLNAAVDALATAQEAFVEENANASVDSDPLPAGTYYMKNVAADKYLTGGNAWGTQASLGAHGLDIKAEVLENGKYTFDSNIPNGGTRHYLGSNGYLDSDVAEWAVIEVAPQTYAITLDSMNFIGYDGSTSVVSLTLTDAASPSAHWQFITKDELIAGMAKATADSPVDATFFIVGQGFNRSDSNRNSAWQGSPAMGGANDNFCAEKWNCNFDIYQELTGLPNGFYKLSAQGYYRAGNGGATSMERYAYLYANEVSTPLQNINVEAGNEIFNSCSSVSDVPDMGIVPNNMQAASTGFTAGLYADNSVLVEVTDGTLRIGVKKDTLINGDWAMFDNFELTYYGTENPTGEGDTLTPIVKTLAALLEQAIVWKGELNGSDEMHAQVIATLEQMIPAVQAVIDNPESEEAVEQMIADVKAMLDTYMPMIEQYDVKVLATLAIEAAQDLMASYTNYTDNAGLAKAITTAQTVLADLGMGWSTIEDVNAALTALIAAQEAFLVENTPNEWCDIYLDLTNGAFLTTEEMENKSQLSFGVIADSLVRVSTEEKCADIILNGKYHSNEHGWTGFSCTVPVEGPVKIGLGACAWGGDVTVKNADGEVVATFSSNNGTCYHSNKTENIVFAYYAGEATTLTISGGNYVPYVSVEKLTEIITEATVTYSLGNVEAEGILPASETVIVGEGKITIPTNYTLYVEGKTLTGWTDGVNTYVAGQEIAPTADMLLTPVFADNQVSLADRTQEVSIIWDFRRQNGAPVLVWQGVTGFLVAQAVVNGQSIDVKMDVDATSGKLANGNWQDWCQVNQGTKFHIPACKGATVSLESYSATTTTTIAGDVINQGTTTPSYIYNGDANAIDVVIGDGSYFRYIKVVLPVVEIDLMGKEYKDEDVSVIWAFTDSIMETPSVTPRGVFSEMNASAGDMILGTISAKGVNYITVQPREATNTTVTWSVTPVHGLTFTPTKVCAKIQRFGTDGGQIDVIVRTNEGVDTLATDLIPLRNTKTLEDDKFAGNEKLCDEFQLDVPASLATKKTFTLTVVIKNLSTTKYIGFSDVRIYGIVNGTVSEPINVSELVSLIAETVAWKGELNPNDEMHAQVIATLEQMIPVAQAVADDPESVAQVEQMIFDVNSMLGTYKPMIAKYDAAMAATIAADEAQALYDSYTNPSDYVGFAASIQNVREGIELLNDMWEPVSIEELASRVEVMQEIQEAFVTENVKNYTPADVNGDGTVSIVDVVAVVNNILGRNAGNFIFDAADMDHNGEITIVDVVSVVNVLLGKNVQATGARSILRSDIHVSDAEVNAGESATLYVKLDNAQAYTAMQMDMTLPEGLSIENVEMVGNSAHAVAYSEEGRIAAYSLANSRFHDGEALMAVTVKAGDSFTGTASVGFTNVRVVSTDVVETVLADAFSTVIGGSAYGIDGVLADEKVEILYYSTTGAVSDKPHKGLNVIKRIYENGRVEVSKVMCE